MARIRSIKPDFWTDEKLVELSLEARLFFIGTWNFADDNGNVHRSAKKLKMQIFPADTIDCETIIQSLIAHGLLTEYSVNGNQYLHINGFRKHQVINRPSKSLIPEPDLSHANAITSHYTEEFNEDSLNDDEVLHDDSVNTHGVLTEDSLTEGKGKERKRKGINTTPLTPQGEICKKSSHKNKFSCTHKPDKVSEPVWSDFVTLRKAKRAPLSQTALQGIEREAEKAKISLEAALSMCCERGWQGFQASWLSETSMQAKVAQKPPPDHWWTSNAGVDRKARELGMTAYSTEDYHSFKDRIFDRLREPQGLLQ